MSGAYAAGGNDGETVFFNPAGMLELVNPQLYFSHLAWWEGIAYDSVWGVQPWGEQGAAGAAVSYLNVPPFNSTDDPSIASDSASGLVGRAGYAYKLNRSLAVGCMLNYLSMQLASEHSWGLSLDAGLKYFLFNGKVVLAAQAQNLGLLGAFESQADNLPMQFSAGIGYHVVREEWVKVLVEGDARVALSDRATGSVGTEVWLWNMLALRGGVNNYSDTGDWLSLGLGVCWQQFHVD
jgi:hypothetical protein